MDVKILGISGSPRHGNTELMVLEALKAAAEIPGVTTDMVSFRGKRISPCVDCDKCPVNPPERYCAIKDSMDEIYPRIIEADGIIIGAPTYFGTVNAQVKALMDRWRPLGRAGGLLKYKVGGAISVGGCRNGGQEKALSAIIDAFILCGVLPVGLIEYLQVGAIGLAWRPGTIVNDEWNCEFLPDRKVTGFDEARKLGVAVAAVTKVVKAGLAQVDPNQFIRAWKLERDKIPPLEGHA